ncbi:DUF6221 family protein [Streptomyces mirabilis]|uniref:DUF6221 family protein n=1 Tax=Streptomyces mirabilis TaxID=68239 RepID=UPI00365FD31B
MTDLHGWIIQQVVRSERVARQAREDIAALAAIAITSSRFAERHIVLNEPAAVLRRCTADRKILADHTTFGDGSVHCLGCGVDYESGPLVGNVNDCPTLLALAEGYGLTPEILAGLDRPQPPPLKSRGPTSDTSRVPAVLRGPNWKGRP